MNVISPIAASKWKDKTAIIDNGRTITYSDLRLKIVQASNALNLILPGTGQPILICLPNSSEFIIWLLAVLAANKVVVPVRYDYNTFEIETILREIDPALIITKTEKCGIIKTDKPILDEYERELLLNKNLRSPLALKTPNGLLAGIHYTYVGDGKLHGVKLTHANYIYAAIGYAKHMGIREDDRILAALPMQTIFILAGCIFTPLMQGATIVISKLSKTIESIKSFRVSILTGVPILYELLAGLSEDRLESIRWGVVGGCPIKAERQVDLSERLGFPIYQGYGLTECFPVLSNSPSYLNKPGSLGLPGRKDIFVRIISKDSRECPTGEIGEIEIKSPTTMVGYYNAPDLTAAVIRRDGWMRTGDLGWVDEDNYVWFYGLKKNIVNIHGNKIDPLEVAGQLSSLPELTKVLITGQSDSDDATKSLVADVWAKEGELVTASELQSYLSASVARYKIPEKINIHKSTVIN